jgi:hypothetical protein
LCLGGIFQGQKAVNTQALTDYSWSYQPENTKKPIVLNFTNGKCVFDQFYLSPLKSPDH